MGQPVRLPPSHAWNTRARLATLFSLNVKKKKKTEEHDHDAHLMSLVACSLPRSRKNPACVLHSRTVTVTRLAVTSVMRT